MSIELPGYNLVQTNPTGVPGSPEAAGAPWRALGGVGHEIQRAAAEAGDFVLRMQHGRNVTMANEMELAANENFAAFQNEILRNTNPGEWSGLWSKRLDDIRKQHVPDNLAPEQQAMIGQRFAEFASRTSVDIGRSAVVAQIGQAKQSYTNLMEQRANMGDYEGAKAANQKAHEEGLWDLPTKEAKDMDISQAAARSDFEQLARTNPEEAKRMLQEKNPDGTWKHYPELPNSVRNKLDDFSDEQRREAAYRAVDDFNAALGNEIKTKDDIKRVFPNISPTLRRRMEDDLEQEQTKAQKDALKSPELQQTMLGRLNAMIDRYRPEISDFDEEYYVMTQLGKQLLESPAKAQALHRLEQVRKGQMETWDSKADLYRSQLKDAYASEVFGSGKVRKPVPQLVNEGLLDDPAKLGAVGYKPEQVAAIAGYGVANSVRLDASALEQLGVSKKTAEWASKNGGREAQRAVAGELWKHRGDAAYDVDPTVFDAMKVVNDGSEGFVEWPDEDKTREAERRYGEAKHEFEGWFKLHPDAKDEDFEKVLQHIFTPEEQKKVDDAFFAPGVLPPK